MRFAPVLLTALLPVLAQPWAAQGQQAEPMPNSAFSEEMLERPDVSAALQHLEDAFDRQVAEWIEITEIPAPSRLEEERAAYIVERIEEAGLEAEVDAIGNVVAERAGTGDGPTLVFAAHLDTVFDLDTDVTVTVDEEEGVLRAPGVYDNSASLANMLAVIRALEEAGIETRGDLIFIGTAQEEIGVKGMAHWLDENPGRADMVVAMDGGLGSISYGALGIWWTRYSFQGDGAHTLASPGRPHPARAMAEAIASIYDEVGMPDDDGGALYNVGQVEGGEVFNAAPEEVSFTVDLRSVNPELLEAKHVAITERVRRAAQEEGVEWDMDVEMAMPAGGTEEDLAERAEHPLIHTAVHLQRYFEVRTGPQEKRATGSTDANAAVVRDYPAISIGRSYGGDQHTLSEWSDIDSALKATQQVLLLAVSLAGID